MTLDAHGGNIYAYKDILLDFSVNLNPLGMPGSVVKAICDNARNFDKYPDTECRELKSAVSRHEGVPGEYLCFGNGAADLIIRICGALKPKKALVAAPTFSEYEAAVRQSGGATEYFYLREEEDFILPPDFADAVSAGTDMVFLCNPNNPTCRLADLSVVEKTADACAACGAVLVVDECFMDFTEGRSAIGLLERHKELIILKAFTKIYSMAGLRLGYLICADTDIVKKISAFGQSWSVSAPAQVAGIAAMGLEGHLERTRKFIKAEREWLSAELKERNLKVYPSDGNFILFKSVEGLWQKAMERGIMLRSCANFRGLGGEFYRIGIKTREANIKLLEVFDEILGILGKENC